MKNKINPFYRGFIKSAVDYSSLVKIVESISSFIIISINKTNENGSENFYRKCRDEIFSPGMLIGIFLITELISYCINNGQ